MSKKSNSPYIPQLFLRVGESVQRAIYTGFERITDGPVGIVKRAITSQRYMVDFGNGEERVYYKDIIRYDENNTRR